MPVAPDRVTARLERVDAAKWCPRRACRPEGEDLIDPAVIDLGLDFTAGKDRLRFRGAIERSIAFGIEQWTHAKAIAREEQRALGTVVDRERELAVEARQQLCAPRLVAVDEHFRVAARAEDVTERL